MKYLRKLNIVNIVGLQEVTIINCDAMIDDIQKHMTDNIPIFTYRKSINHFDQSY